ncbi:pregnancy-associated plasma protein-A [Winogradskyella wandonensis]|uniref:Pregnancy-associated plasma protein-A n=1 Tax=Winogradskyella wandonensis TaxID=1442586 RepID=A0A4R1KSE1_9FLAO|nr:zinc metalloprotease [Winogradskyella wandonensis]TCK67958.1 pregnancy-associated plasma protein-A [Winogradskyella wandonensis]
MKKTILGLAAMALLFTGCNDDSNNLEQEQSKVDMSDFYLYTDATDNGSTSRVANGKTCASMEVLNRQLNENPGLYQRMYDIELNSRQFMANARPKGGNGGGPGGGGGSGDGDVDVLPVSDNLGVINIPVNVIIVAPNSSSVSSQQVNSQIATLNADFRNTNVNQLPSGTTFANDATDAGFSFTLANVTRFDDSRTSWGTNNAVKSAYPSDPATRDTHLTMWVCPIGGGILGYAQFPGGNASTDGVVVDPAYFGNTSGPFGLGRTMTHEVGHWLNLRHIWGDGRCRQDDFVADTPSSDGPNYGCPSYPTVNCKSADMTMNYMDYVNDACMYMFTDGQRNRMRAIFAPGGPRASYVGN